MMFNRTKQLIFRQCAMLMAFALVFTTVCSNSLIAKATDGKGDDSTVSDNTVSDNIIVDGVNGELLQCSGGWTISRTVDENGKPEFDVTYFGQNVEELKESNLYVQYRTIRRETENDSYQFIASEWYDIDYELPEDKLNDILQYKNKHLVQFRLVDSLTEESERPESHVFYIYPQEQESPHILSATYSITTNFYDYCDIYDLVNLTNKFHITLRVSEHLEKVGDLSVIPSTRLDSYLQEYSASNLTFENCLDDYYVNGEKVIVKYALMSFDVELSPTVYVPDDSVKASYFNYQFRFNGVQGIRSKNIPESLRIVVYTPTTTVRPAAKLVKSINITGEHTVVEPGSHFGLTATVLPNYADNKSVTWSSSNDAYASVDYKGYVLTNAVGAGKTVTITATSNDGSGVKGTYTFTITQPTMPNEPQQPSEPETPSNPQQPSNPQNPSGPQQPSESGQQSNPQQPNQSEQPADTKISNIKLTAPYKTVQAGKKVNVTATITPADATNQTLTWTSSNKKYATVNSKGVVTTKKAGIGKTVTITAKSNDGSGKKATLKIKIVKTVKATKIKLTSKSKTVKAGKKVTVKATFSPSNVSNKKLTWTSSNKKYATVNSKGVVTTKHAGKGKTVKITAKAKDGSGKKASIKIKMK